MINTYVALDLETTGTSPGEDRIIEIGAVKIVDGVETDRLSTFVNPEMRIPERITMITGINDGMVENAPKISEVIEGVAEFTEGMPLLGHNIIFDYSFLKCAAMANELRFEREGIDTLKIARRVLADAPSKRLEYLCEYMHIDAGTSHRAFDDARSARYLYEKMYEINPQDDGFVKAQELNFAPKKKSKATPAQIKYIYGLMSSKNISLETTPEEMSKSEASRIIDMILSGQLS